MSDLFPLVNVSVIRLEKANKWSNQMLQAHKIHLSKEQHDLKYLYSRYEAYNISSRISSGLLRIGWNTPKRQYITFALVEYVYIAAEIISYTGDNIYFIGQQQIKYHKLFCKRLNEHYYFLFVFIDYKFKITTCSGHSSHGRKNGLLRVPSFISYIFWM